MTFGCYFLAGRELNGTTVAAILTIIGFSINDTVVIFDRIREDLKMGVRGSFRELVNQALNQTLSRTIITSGTVFLATMSLFIFGGGPVNDFAFTFLVGIHHRHVFLDLHRQRVRALVAQGPASRDRGRSGGGRRCCTRCAVEVLSRVGAALISFVNVVLISR